MRSLLRYTLLFASVLVACGGISGCSSEPESQLRQDGLRQDGTGPMDKPDSGKMAGAMDKMETGKMNRPHGQGGKDKMGGTMDKMDKGKMSGPMDKMEKGKME